MVETPAYPDAVTQASIDPDLQPAATSGHGRAAATGPFGVAWPVLAVIAAGGVAGALGRFGLTNAFPYAAGRFAWATFGINVSGCLLIGVLMVLVSEVWTTKRLLRPFLGTGVLGGYTTFSTHILDVQQMLAAGAARTALVYLLSTLLTALVAVYGGITLTRCAVRRIYHRGETR